MEVCKTLGSRSQGNVSHCMSLSAYLIDAIVISGNSPKIYVFHVIDSYVIAGLLWLPVSSNWETP